MQRGVMGPAIAAVLGVAAVAGTALGIKKISDDHVKRTSGEIASTFPAQTPPAESPAQRMERVHSLAAALAIAQPFMTDSFNKVDEGTVLLTIWAMQAMRWSDVAVSKDETSYALVQKDADEERGRRLCTSGSVAEIATKKSDVGKMYEGLLMNGAGNLYRFFAVGSSGALVQHSYARFCGAATGKFDYANSGGGTSHAIKIVGMFDLPENKSSSPNAEVIVAPASPTPRAAPAITAIPSSEPTAAPRASASTQRDYFEDCASPFFLDNHGVRHYKPECIR